MEACDGCAWFIRERAVHAFGECHRHAPAAMQISGRSVRVWPAVNEDDGCGDWLKAGDEGRCRQAGAASLRH